MRSGLHFGQALSQQTSPPRQRHDRFNGYGLLRSALACCVALTLTGCLIKRNDYQVPSYPLPQSVTGVSGVTGVTGGTGATVTADQSAGTDTDHVAWWTKFGNPELNALVQRGLANNPDLRIAVLHVAQARIRANQAHGARYPSVDASVAAGPQHGSTPSATTSGATLGATWEVDLWGERAAAAQEADYQLWQAKFDADNTKRALIANIAASYVDYLSANDRIRTARQTEAILSELLETVQKRTTAGDATMQEQEQQRAALFSERALLPGLILQRDNAAAAIASLLGTLSGGLQLSDDTLESLQQPDPAIEIPTSVLLRRADVRSMEARLLAADVDIDVMRARLLPSFTLSAQTGYSGLLEQLIGPKSFFWNLFGTVSANVFDAGQRSADIDQARLVHEEMATNYAKTLLQALRETETALKTIRASDQRVQFQREALQSASNAWNISKKMYLIGGTDFMTLQDTERTYQRYAEDTQQLRADYYHGYISLFQAIGATTEDPREEGDGIVWQAQKSGQGQDLAWMVELDGVYQGDTVAAVLQDLQARHPDPLNQKKLYPALLGTTSDVRYGKASWYRLRVGKFTTLVQAQQFCDLLKHDLQRCQAVADQ